MLQADISLTATYTYAALCTDLLRLQQQFPFVEVINIGRSVEGRNLFAIGLGIGEKQVHYTAGLHANEWITTPVLVKFCFDYARSVAANQLFAGGDVAGIFRECTMWLTPATNPDGAELVQKGLLSAEQQQKVLALNRGSEDFRNWKANINGVDLNHQFPANWNVQAARSPKTPSARNYAGSAPLTEPEAQALADFTEKQEFSAVIALHTQGEVIYWGYRGFEPNYSATISKKLACLTGYRAIRYAGTDAGYKDWFIEKWRRPGFTIEAGRGKNPLPVSQFNAIYGKVIKALLGCAKAVIFPVRTEV